MRQAIEQQNEGPGSGQSVVDAVQANSLLLHQLLARLTDLQNSLGIDQLPSIGDAEVPATASELATHRECEAERLRLDNQIGRLELQLQDLTQQNRELAGKVADSSVRQRMSPDESNQSLSWEERKMLVLKQLEEDSFDAESFVANLPYHSEEQCETPELFVERIVRELESRNREINDLRHLLEQQSATHSGQVAIGASAIAHMIDADELVQQERERLQTLQAEWEQRFREGEIEASLERATLSRERQELARRRAELEEELQHHRREILSKVDGEGDTQSNRRWLVKLGLSDR